jgi:S1-C subfamily serine protease
VSRRSVVAAVALATAVLGAGCGSEQEPDSGSAGRGSDRVVIETADGSFNPGAVYERDAPGVVTVASIFGGNAGGILEGQNAAGQGSGFVISDEGEIVTNAHVVTDGQAGGGGKISEAKEVYVQFPDRNQVPAEVVGFDPFADVALLKVDPEGLSLKPIELGSDESVAIGEPVAAIGSPFGEEQSLSTGIVSATDRSIQSLTEFQIDGAIQTDASINPGNSGGPLLDGDGNVVGINQQINTTSGGNEGVGYAVPVDLVKRSVDQLRADGEVVYAYIGVTTQPLYPQLAERLEIDSGTGALVAEVVEGGPAAEAGIRGGDQKVKFQGIDVDAGGDVITAVNGEELVGETDLPRIISRLDPGDTVTLEIIRDGSEEEVDVTLGERPESPTVR